MPISFDPSILKDPAQGFTQVIILPYLPNSVSGTWAFAGHGNALFGSPYYNSTHANGNYLLFKVWLPAGSMSWKLIYDKNTDKGIVDVVLDDVSQGTVDTYAGASGLEYSSTGTITSLFSGVHTLKLLVNGKNALSSDYYVYLRLFGIYGV